MCVGGASDGAAVAMTTAALECSGRELIRAARFSDVFSQISGR